MILYFILTLTIFLLAPFHKALWANCHKASVVIWKILNIRFTSAFCYHFNKPALSNKVCMYQEAMPWVPEVFFSSAARLRTVSLLSLSVERNARDTQMTTCETEGTRRERHDKALVSRVLQLFHSTQVHACTPLTKSDEKERLLAV